MRSTHFEIYKGIAIAVTTVQNGEVWSAKAVYALSGQNEVRIDPPERDYTTEDEARGAALQAAVESIDRARAFIGKP
jgi:hypothetical protein